MPWLLDGNNLAHGGGREEVRRAALGLARRERVRIAVFFDGAPPAGGQAKESLGAVEVHYVPHADTAIILFLRAGGRGWRVATDDRELARRVRAVGAEAVGAAVFWRKAAAAEEDATVARPALERELAYFGDPSHRLLTSSRRVRRPLRTRRGR